MKGEHFESIKGKAEYCIGTGMYGQNRVIKKSSVTPYILSLWGKKDVSPKTIGKVAKALETDVTELLADSKGAAQ